MKQAFPVVDDLVNSLCCLRGHDLDSNDVTHYRGTKFSSVNCMPQVLSTLPEDNLAIVIMAWIRKIVSDEKLGHVLLHWTEYGTMIPQDTLYRVLLATELLIIDSLKLRLRLRESLSPETIYPPRLKSVIEEDIRSERANGVVPIEQQRVSHVRLTKNCGGELKEKAERKMLAKQAALQRTIRKGQRLTSSNARRTEGRKSFLLALNKLPIAEQLHQLAIDTTYSVTFYPTCCAVSSKQQIIETLDISIRLKLLAKLKGKHRGPWGGFKQRLLSSFGSSLFHVGNGMNKDSSHTLEV